MYPEIWEKKPVQVQVARWIGTLGMWNSIKLWSGEQWEVDDEKNLLIPTLEGTMKAAIGDFIIRGVNGEFYPCKPDIFAKTYRYVGRLENDTRTGTAISQTSE